MEPEYPDYTLLFDSFSQIDNSNLTWLTLFAGSTGANYADQTDDGFTFSRDGINIEVNGSDFVYTDGVPVGGFVTGMGVMVGNATAYAFGGAPSEDERGFPISTFFTTDPAAIANVLFAGNDVIGGSNLDDVIYGYAGDDQISGAGGENVLYGGDGNDLVYGGSNEGDKLYGDVGDDWLFNGKGDDKLYGGDGFDIVSYDGRLSPVKVNLGQDKVKAKIGFNEVDKLKGIEGVLGGLGKDKLIGNGDDNHLGGYSNNDILKGKGGDDLLVGGWGIDTLEGGKGDDIFLFDLPVDVRNAPTQDIIKDFGRGNDSLHFDQEFFSALDAGVLSPEHFYAAPGAFAGIGETYLVYDTKNGVLYYDESGDGSGKVFEVATLKGAPTLTASDIFVIEYVEDLDI
jgi:Ca2+-binding RTX toxin-like protein